MNEKRLFSVLLAGICISMIGCSWGQTQPTIPPAQPTPTHAKFETELVAADSTQPTQGPDEAERASQEQIVQEYIQRIDDIERRVQLSPPPNEPSVTKVVSDSSSANPTNPTPTPDGQHQDTEDDISRKTDPIKTKPTEIPDSIQPALEAPVLASVSVRAQPATITPPKTQGETNPTSVNSTVIARQAPISLDQFLRQWPGDPDDTSFRQQLDLRLLRVVAGDYEGARAPLSMVSDGQQELSRRFLESLIVIRQAHDGDPANAATRALHELERLKLSLRPLCELRIPTVAICQEVLGFGQYRPIEPPIFPAGLTSEFVVYCELRDFVSEQQDDGLYLATFEMRTIVLNRIGEAVLEIRDTDIVDRCRQPRHDCFIPRLVRLPATLSPGEYVVKITIIDKLGEKVAENRATFRVAAGQ